MNTIPLQWIIVAAVVVLRCLHLRHGFSPKGKSNPRGFGNGSVRNTGELSVSSEGEQRPNRNSRRAKSVLNSLTIITVGAR